MSLSSLCACTHRGLQVPLIISDACGEDGATARGAFVLVPGGCDATTAARNILNRGGLAMLVGENDNTFGLPTPTVRLASALVVEGIANWIFGNASRSSRITITRALVSQEAGRGGGDVLLAYMAAWATCQGGGWYSFCPRPAEVVVLVAWVKATLR